ncbi:MAG TPA: PQQ-binding-like beta-propeller repeat protein [Acidobacteriaceae bacterium]|nr:PQQ-binding-like beta-propeller repeat protein [Acidobacteriaceae bacterium]
MRCASLTAVLCLTLSAAAQTGAPKGEWPTYGGDLGNTRYSALDQINAANFNQLQIAWQFKTVNFGPEPEYNLESTPLMMNGILYTTAGSRRAVVALDAATGEVLWMHAEHEGARGAAAPRQLSGHGLAYWTDGKQERILYVTPGYRLIALDAKTGVPIPSFGDQGVVDLRQNDDQEMDLVKADIGLHSTPIVAGNTVIVGAAHSMGGWVMDKSNVKGYVRGFDVLTGRRLWIFHTIPRKGEFGYNTWENGAADYTGNTGVWAQISVDENLGMVYLPVESPTQDYYGGDRPGSALFAESIVALDLKTGQRKWHYQLVHHGIWDFDIPCAPVLVNITVDGKPIKALAQATKQSILYVLNRETGQPVWPFVERPVPRGDVPGEWYAPTQPFPTKPPFYDRNGFSLDQLIDFTPELRAQALEIASKFKIGPIFTPAVVSNPNGPLGTLIIGFPNGGTNWAGGSFDPQTHIFYVFSQGIVSGLGLVPPDDPNAKVRYWQGIVQVSGHHVQRLTIHGLPLIKPPYGRISAIDLDQGEIKWQIAHGETPDEIRNNPALKGLQIPRTGRPGIIGVLTTKTLVIAGEGGTFTNSAGKKGALLRAYDKASGADAGAVYMPAGQTGSPMTYMLNGKQYIVLAVGGPGFPGELLAYTLPN